MNSISLIASELIKPPIIAQRQLLKTGYWSIVVLTAAFLLPGNSGNNFKMVPVGLAEGGKYVCSRQADSLALVDLFVKTKGEDWINSWDLSVPIDQWFGVKLNEGGCIKCLDLDGDPNCNPTKNGGNNLSGTMPDLQLPYLEHLFLAGNKLTGAIPDFTSMPYLLTLQLCCNRFSETIPDFTNLPKLLSLELDYNKLKGEIPDFSKLDRLQNLYISNNQLSGYVPSFHFLPDLKRLYLQHNQLSGRFPNLDASPQLQRLSGFDNAFEGPLPEMSQLRKLTHLNLAGNKLSGQLPIFNEQIQLKSLILAHNRFEGKITGLPKMANLEALDLSGNMLEGPLPDFSENPNLKTLLLADNGFTKCPDFSNLTKLAYCSLRGNALDFSDLVPNKSFLTEPKTYTPQDIALPDTILNLKTGEDLNLQLRMAEVPNATLFKWEKDGETIADDENDAVLKIKNLQHDDAGIYSCTMTNPSLPGLTIRSNRFVVQLTEEEAEPVEDTAVPIANDDEFSFQSSDDGYAVDLVKNDEFEEVSYWTAKILTSPEIGFIEDRGEGVFKYISPPGFFGTVEFEYELCNIAGNDLCSIALAVLNVEAPKRESAAPDFFVPGGISPNGDGLNDLFEIPALNGQNHEYQDNEVIIVNQNGQLVFRASPYFNNWGGTYKQSGNPLPEGIYFFSVILSKRKGLAKQGTMSILR